MDLQPSPPTRRPQPQDPDRPPQRAEQPGWALQLAARNPSARRTTLRGLRRRIGGRPVAVLLGLLRRRRLARTARLGLGLLGGLVAVRRRSCGRRVGTLGAVGPFGGRRRRAARPALADGPSAVAARLRLLVGAALARGGDRRRRLLLGGGLGRRALRVGVLAPARAPRARPGCGLLGGGRVAIARLLGALAGAIGRGGVGRRRGGVVERLLVGPGPRLRRARAGAPGGRSRRLLAPPPRTAALALGEVAQQLAREGTRLAGQARARAAQDLLGLRRVRHGGGEQGGLQAAVLLARGVHQPARVAGVRAAARVHEQAQQALGLGPALDRVLLMDLARVLGQAPDPRVGLVAAPDALLGERLEHDLGALAALLARPGADDVDREVEGLGVLGRGDLLQRAHAQLRVAVALDGGEQEAALELAGAVEVQHGPRPAPAAGRDARPGQRGPHVLLPVVEVLDRDAPQLALEDLVTALFLRRDRDDAALDAHAAPAAATHRTDDDGAAAVDVAVQQRVQGDDRVVVLGRGMDEVDDDAGLLARVPARHTADALLVDTPRGGRREMHADGRAGRVPALGQQLRVDQHVDLAALVGGEDLGQLALGRLARDGLGLDALLAHGLGDVVGVAHAGGVDHARHAVEARLVEVGDRHVERQLVQQLGQHLLVELDVDVAAAQRHLRDRAHAWAGRDADAAQRRDDAAACGLREVEARGLRGEQIGDVAGDERARGGHADEDGAGPGADRRRRLLAQRGVRLVADDDRVGVGDAPGVAHEPLVGLDGDGPVGAIGSRAVEQRRGLAVAVAAGVQLAQELVDEGAPGGEDEHAAGARGLDEAHRGHGLAGAGGVLEPEALVSVGIVGGALLDILVDVGLVVVLPNVLGLLVLVLVVVGLGLVVLVVLVILFGGGLDLRLVVVIVVLVLVLIGLGLGLFVRRRGGGRLGLGLVVDREHRLGGRRGEAVAVLDGGQQGGQGAREGVDLVGVEQRAVGQARLVLAEHALEAEQQRVTAAPLGRGHGRAGIDLAQCVLEGAAPRGARGERDGGVFAVVNEALTCERFGALDGGLIGNRCGLSGRRHGISHDLAICAERRVAARFSACDSEPPGWSGDDAREGLPWIQRPSP